MALTCLGVERADFASDKKLGRVGGLGRNGAFEQARQFNYQKDYVYENQNAHCQCGTETSELSLLP